MCNVLNDRQFFVCLFLNVLVKLLKDANNTNPIFDVIH